MIGMTIVVVELSVVVLESNSHSSLLLVQAVERAEIQIKLLDPRSQWKIQAVPEVSMDIPF